MALSYSSSNRLRHARQGQETVNQNAQNERGEGYMDSWSFSFFNIV